jgi:acetyl-CoA synthetase
VDPTAGREAYRVARDFLVEHREDYDRAVAHFRWPTVGARFNWALDWFEPLAVGNRRTALRVISEDGTDRSYSFAEMSSRSNRLAASLATAGVEAGDRVMVMLGNQVELWESMLAAMKLGAVILPTTTALGPDDLADRVARGAVRHVITSADQTGKFTDIAGDFGRVAIGEAPAGWQRYQLADAGGPPLRRPTVNSPDDPMLVYFTSGTTSQPKMVEHTHRSYPVGHMTTMYFIGLRPGDVHLNISAPGWAKHAWSSLFAPWIAESTILVYNYARFDPSRFLTMLRHADVTSLCAPPTVWRMLIQATLGDKPPMLRELVGAGEPLNAEIIDHVRKCWGLTVRDGFGQTETSALIGNTPRSAVKPGSMGRPLPGVEVELVDPLTGLPADEGEICLKLKPRPVNLMSGYLGGQAHDNAASGDGYYHTGDVASRDSDGYFTYIGRTDDVFKASDYKISPFELESVLLEHAAVAEAAVVPAPDKTRLAVPKAYIALAAGWQPDKSTADQIFDHAHRKLAPYQRIRRIEFFDLPKTASGKIRRNVLRARENSSEASDASQQEYRDR